ncbi:MAG TPA: zf-HC2 domain-containing protein [Herpetosiphonaceae bacterium]
MEQLSHNHPDNTSELLSAYIDNAVDAVERRQVERYIQTCPACTQELQELRMFRALLRDLPMVQPRRSFTLDPAAVAPRRLLFPTLRWATLVATALFLVVVGVDVLRVGRPNAGMSFSAAASPPAQESAPFAAPQQGGSDAAGGAPETMMQPAESPAASPPDTGRSAAMPSGSPSPSEGATTAVASGAEAGNASSGTAASDTAAYPPSAGTTLAVGTPEAAINPLASPAASPAAGGAAEQPQQPAFKSYEPAGADTTTLDQDSTAQGAWWSSFTLRLAELVLGIIALGFGAAALWTWRRHM